MRRIYKLAAALMVLAALAGCQDTPEEPVVVGKNVDILIDKATETEEPLTATPAPTCRSNTRRCASTSSGSTATGSSQRPGSPTTS